MVWWSAWSRRRTPSRLRNNTDGPVTVNHVGFFVTSTNHFVIVSGASNLCDGQTVPPAGTCTFEVQFTPQSAGPKGTTLGATFTGTAACRRSAGIRALGHGAQAGACRVDPGLPRIRAGRCR